MLEVRAQAPGARGPVPSPRSALAQPHAHGLAVERAGPRDGADRRAGIAQPADLRVEGLSRGRCRAAFLASRVATGVVASGAARPTCSARTLRPARRMAA